VGTGGAGGAAAGVGIGGGASPTARGRHALLKLTAADAPTTVAIAVNG
jgi:hypothetical protein